MYNDRFLALFLVIFLIQFTSLKLAAQQSPASNDAAAAAGSEKKPAGTEPEKTKPQAESPAPDPTRGMMKPSLPPAVDPKTGTPLYLTIQEDWSSLSIGVSKLEPEPPLVAQTDETDHFIRTLVQLKWRPGDPLDLYVILPKGVKNPPAVLYLYSYKDDTDRFKNDDWCERATRGGTAAIGFVSALTGHRFQSRPLEQWFVSELQESLGSTVHDVKFILDYLAARGDVDMNRIGMFGQASGGAIALLAAAADPRLKAVDVLDPWGDWSVWLAKSPIVKEDIHGTNFAQPDFLKRVENLDPVKWLPTLTSTRVRIQQVMDNIATPDECKTALRNAAPKNAEIVRYDHVSDLAKSAGEGHLFDWVKAKLNQLPASSAGRAGALVTGLDSKAGRDAKIEAGH